MYFTKTEIPIAPRKGDRTKLLLQNKNNSVYNIVKEIKLFLYIRNNNSFLEDTNAHELFSYSENDLDQVGKILSIRDLRKMAWYFLDYGAATASILQNRLGISQASTYRHMTNLKAFNFISLAIKTMKPRGKKGGPRAEVWMVPDAEIEHIKEAQKLHRRLSSPKYVAGERLGQLILEEYMEPKNLNTITGKEVMKIAREKGVKYSILDISNMAMDYLHERGMKVWR